MYNVAGMDGVALELCLSELGVWLLLHLCIGCTVQSSSQA
jgi:hypothetical protein